MTAPIFVTVYNRIEHLRKCINSLKECDLANETVLYISSDAPKYVQDEEIIREIREFIHSITGFKQVIPFCHKTNIGLHDAYFFGINYIFEKHDKIIFLEDDIIVAPDFLKFVNDGLIFFENNPKIFAISAFSFSIFYNHNLNDSRTYFTNRYSAWGCGIWKKKLLQIPEYSLEDLRLSLKDKKFIKKIDSIGIDLYPSLLSSVDHRKMLTLDFLTTYHLVRSDLFCVSPYVSKTFNIGNDGSGTRTRKSKRFKEADLSFLTNRHDYSFSDNINVNINNSFYRNYYKNKYQRIKRLLLKLGLLKYVLNLKSIIS